MDLRIVLVEPKYERNIGSIARLVKNFGFNKLWLVTSRLDLGSDAKIYAAHAKDIINNAVIVKDLDEAFQGVNYIVGTTAIVAKKSSNVLRQTITPEELANRIVAINGKIALLFGRESNGLPNDVLNKCNIIVTIPANPLYRTLNIASASAIILYELWKAQIDHPRGCFEGASKEHINRLIQLFNRLSHQSGLPAYKCRLATRAFQNIVSRAFISKREATLMLGVLRKSMRTTRPINS
jgi:TrmH family RNA methyltransferase